MSKNYAKINLYFREQKITFGNSIILKHISRDINNVCLNACQIFFLLFYLFYSLKCTVLEFCFTKFFSGRLELFHKILQNNALCTREAFLLTTTRVYYKKNLPAPCRNANVA